ncbi:MAG: CPBP family intramembrane metalloprotease [Candidatus Wildermuthbacteria bacterium]|nr:CPBP family intramembrane metalloprotease [Candidatus Wildermuthbacteria bacterium]
MAIFALASIPLAALMFYGIGRFFGQSADDPVVALLASDVWVYGTLISWTAWQITRSRIKVKAFLGRVPRNPKIWLLTAGITVASFFFSLGCIPVVTYLLALGAPGMLDYLLEGTDSFSESATPILYTILTALSLMILAPVIEEVVFRGILMHRWAVKWSPGVAIIATSIVFGIVHDLNGFGAMVFGLVAGLLYFKTGSLLVPIFAHFLNNGIVFLYLLFNTAITRVMYPAQELVVVMAGLILLVVTGPILFAFARHSWPGCADTLPYFRNTRQKSDASPADSRVYNDLVPGFETLTVAP